LEALHIELSQDTSVNQDAKLIVITNSNGQETRRLVRLNRQKQAKATTLIDKFLASPELLDPAIKEAVLALLTEQLLNKPET
jgi:protein-arginine kinase